MTTEAKTYPRPRLDEINRTYLDAWRGGRLMLQHCGHCDALVYYPRPLCPNCWSDWLEWRECSGDGRIVSFSLVYRPNHASFFDEVPIVLAEIRLKEGASMLARVVCNAPETVCSGQGVRLLPPESASRYPLPTFGLADGGGEGA
jgi:uncharacterized protein